MPLITPSIGIFKFLNMQDYIDYVGLKFVDITRPGYPGRAFQTTNILGEPSPIRTLTALTGLDKADLAMKNYKAWNGSVVRVVDQLGSVRNNIWITDVRQVDAWATGGHANDPLILALMTAVWTLVDTSVAY